jgi:hypothetical protein
MQSEENSILIYQIEDVETHIETRLKMKRFGSPLSTWQNCFKNPVL